MNKKLGIIIGSVIIVILVIAGGAFALKKMTKQALAPVTTSTTQPNSAKSQNIFSTIQDALSRNLSLSCNINNQGNKTVTYMKNGMIRVDIAGKTIDQNGSVIMRDNKVYYWNTKSAIVMAFNIKEISQNAGANSANPGQVNPKDYMTMMEQYKNDCKNADVSDNLFVVPGDIKFQDISQMMKVIPSVPGGANGGVAPSVNPSTYQQMMQQYQNSARP